MDYWEIVLGLLVVAGSALAGGKLWLHHKIKQTRELVRSMDEALSPEGPGGANLTKDEILDIWADFKAVLGIPDSGE